MRCPRCDSTNEAAARRCESCGAPLALADEPAPSVLDRPLDLDRRGGTRGGNGGGGRSLFPGAPDWEMDPPMPSRPGSSPARPTRPTGPGRRGGPPQRARPTRSTPSLAIPSAHTSAAPTFEELEAAEPRRPSIPLRAVTPLPRAAPEDAPAPSAPPVEVSTPPAPPAAAAPVAPVVPAPTRDTRPFARHQLLAPGRLDAEPGPAPADVRPTSAPEGEVAAAPPAAAGTEPSLAVRPETSIDDVAVDEATAELAVAPAPDQVPPVAAAAAAETPSVVERIARIEPGDGGGTGVAPAVAPSVRSARGAAHEVHRTRAAPWRRAAAWAVDLSLLGTAVGLVLFPVMRRSDLPADASPDAIAAALTRGGSALVPALLLAAAMAFTYQWLGTALAGATPGKWLAGLRVVGPDGARPTPGRTAVRTLLAIPSFALLGLGALLALFTRSGRGLHDLLARTWVVRAGPSRAAGGAR